MSRISANFYATSIPICSPEGIVTREVVVRSVLATFLLFSFPALAEDTDVSGIGSHTCAQFAEGVRQNPAAEDIYFTWAEAFMSGVNFVAESKGEPLFNLGSAPADQQKHFITQFCDKHPMARYLLAAKVLMQTFPRFEFRTTPQFQPPPIKSTPKMSVGAP
jgi:hypothetical protein